MVPSACHHKAPSPVDHSCACREQSVAACRGRAQGTLGSCRMLSCLAAAMRLSATNAVSSPTCELHRDPGVVLLGPGDVAPESGCIEKFPAVLPGRRPPSLVHGQHVLAQRPVLQPGGSRSAPWVPVGLSEQHSELCALTMLAPAVSARCLPMGLSEQHKRCTVSSVLAQHPVLQPGRPGAVPAPVLARCSSKC